MSGFPDCMQPGSLSHRAGQVTAADGGDVSGLFVAGWAKRGPTGIIGTNRADAVETVQTLLARLPDLITRKLRADPIEALFAARAMQPLSYAQWLQIDQWERQRGAALGKPREKVLSPDDVAAALGIRLFAKWG